MTRAMLPPVPSVQRQQAPRNLTELSRACRDAATLIAELDAGLSLYRVQASLPKFLKERGERNLVDLTEAARTLNAYAGFLQLAIAEAKRAAARKIEREDSPVHLSQ